MRRAERAATTLAVLRRPPKLHRAFGDQIGVARDVRRDLIEQFVERDERRPLDVPMGLFALELQVDAVGKPLVEQSDGVTPIGLRQVVSCGMEPAPAGAGL